MEKARERAPLSVVCVCVEEEVEEEEFAEDHF
jgi:hypothetical protein